MLEVLSRSADLGRRWPQTLYGRRGGARLSPSSASASELQHRQGIDSRRHASRKRARPAARTTRTYTADGSAHGYALDMPTVTERVCARDGCENPIPAGSRADRRYCTDACRTAACSARQRRARLRLMDAVRQAGDGPPEPPALDRLRAAVKDALQEEKLVAVIAAEARHNWRASAWLLSRLHPTRWGERGAATSRSCSITTQPTRSVKWTSWPSVVAGHRTGTRAAVRARPLRGGQSARDHGRHGRLTYRPSRRTSRARGRSRVVSR